LSLIITILLIVDLFLWFLAMLPVPQAAQFNWASSWMAWIAALLLTILVVGGDGRVAIH
jgi:amino acid transporter